MTVVDAGSVVVVGRGRMGSLLAQAWRTAGVRVTLVAGRGVGEGPRPETAAAATLWVLAVRDAAIAATAEALGPWVHTDDVVVHLAGMQGPAVLGVLRGRVAGLAGAHPLVAVSSAQAGRSLAGGAVLCEGDAAAVARCESAFGCLGVAVFSAPTVHRPTYHGGAALVATGAVALAQGATHAFRAALGAAATEAMVRAGVASLLRSVADNVLADGADAALASPLLRNDAGSVAMHLGALGAVDPHAAAVYRAALGRVVATLRDRGGVSAETLVRAEALARGEG